MNDGSASAESTKYTIARAMSRTPATTAGMIRLRFLVMSDLSGDGEDDGQQAADDQAVDGERREAVGLEVLHEEAHRQVGGDGGAERAHQRRAAHAVTLVPGQLGQLEDRGGADDRRRQEEREPGRVLVG